MAAAWCSTAKWDLALLDAEAAVKLARFWSLQSTAANEQHLGGSFVLPAEFSTTSQSFEVTIDNPGDGRLLGRLRRADARSVRPRPQGPRHRACLARRNQGADCAQPSRRGRPHLSRLHLLVRRDARRKSVRHLDPEPDASDRIRRIFGAQCRARHLWRQQGQRRHPLFHLGLCAACRGRPEPVDRHGHQWRHRHAELRGRQRQAGARPQRPRSRAALPARRCSSTAISKTRSAPPATTSSPDPMRPTR